MADAKGIAVLAFIAAPIVLMAGGGIYLAIKHFATSAGKGTVNVLAPPDSALEVRLDAEPATKIAAGESRAFAIAQGPHDVILTDGSGDETRHHLEVKDGFFHDLLPTRKQCFAVLDVTHWIYRSEHPGTLGEEAVELPIDARLTSHRPIHLVKGVYVALADTPDRIAGGDTVRLTMDLPCDAVSGPDEALVAAARRRLASWRDVGDAR